MDHDEPQASPDAASGAPDERSVVTAPELTEVERGHLERCLELAEQAVATGDEPFGSVLVSADGERLAEGRNRVVATGDRTQHPEIELARWAAQHLSHDERARATVFTSGEHCPMCAAAHGWVGLGRIVYAHSSQQLAAWLSELGVPAAPVRPLPVHEVVPHLRVDGPVPDLALRMRELHRRSHAGTGAGQPSGGAGGGDPG